MLRNKILEGLKPCTIYCFLNFGFYVIWTYINLQARQLGLSMSDISLISGFVPFIVALVAPLIAYIGDRFGNKPIHIVLILTISAVSVAATYIPNYNEVARFKVWIEDDNTTDMIEVTQFGEYTDKDRQCRRDFNLTITKIQCQDSDSSDFNYNLVYQTIHNTTSRDGCSMYENDYCLYELDGAVSTNHTTHCDATIKNEDNTLIFGLKTTTFILYFLFKVIFSLCLSPIWSIADTIATKVAKKIKVELAVFMFFGGLTNIAAPLTMGFLLDKINNEVTEFDCITGEGLDTADYSIPFFIFAGVNAILVLILIFLKIDGRKDDAEDKEGGKNQQKTSRMKELEWALKPAAIGFYFLLVVIGSVISAWETFYGVFLIEDLNVSDKWFGVANAIALANGSATCLLGAFLKKKVKSIHIVFVVSIGLSIRVLLLGYNRTYEPEEMPVEIFLASAFLNHDGINAIGIIGYVEVITPSHLIGTGISLSWVCMFVIGRGLGSFLAGVLNDLVGTRSMLIIIGSTGVGYTLLYSIFYQFCIKKKETNPDALTKSMSEGKEKHQPATLAVNQLTHQITTHL